MAVAYMPVGGSSRLASAWSRTTRPTAGDAPINVKPFGGAPG